LPILFKDILHYGDIGLPYQIIAERRRTIRVSIAAKGAYLRLPMSVSKNQIEKHHAQFLTWAKKQLNENQEIRRRFKLQPFKAHRHLQVMDKVFSIYAKVDSERDRLKVHLNKNLQEVHILLSQEQEYQQVPPMLSRNFSKAFSNEIKSEVALLNSRHFNFDYNQVRLKYNATNWGSCSRKKNINLSSRLLLVPDEVRHYVIVHELAHLQEMNHSKRYWQLVESALPDYKEYEQWLKKDGKTVDFA